MSYYACNVNIQATSSASSPEPKVQAIYMMDNGYTIYDCVQLSCNVPLFRQHHLHWNPGQSSPEPQVQAGFYKASCPPLSLLHLFFGKIKQDQTGLDRSAS